MNISFRRNAIVIWFIYIKHLNDLSKQYNVFLSGKQKKIKLGKKILVLPRMSFFRGLMKNIYFNNIFFIGKTYNILIQEILFN